MGTFIEHVVSYNFEASADSLVARATRSFLRTIRRHEITELTPEVLELWIVDMTLDDFQKTTRKRYFGKMAALYLEWKSAPGENPFEATREIAEMDHANGFSEASKNLTQVANLLQKERKCIDRELIDVFLYLLYNVNASIDDVINLKFEDRLADNPQTHDLIDEVRKTAGNRKYVFGLNRNNKRITQVRSELLSGLHGMLKSAGMKFDGGFSRDSITAIWMAAALRSGMSFGDIRSAVTRVPLGYHSLKLIKSGELNHQQHTIVLNQVANSINDKATQWYVMKMRAGQTPDDIKKQIQLTDSALYERMLFYYPTHTESKKDAKGKIVKKDTPYIPSIMFFKVRRDKISSLMHHIGASAWCYKESNTLGSPYCTISHQEMMNFQRHIGQFTPDIKIELVTLDQPLNIGTEVKINGGGRMVGQIGKIQSVKNANNTRTYTLALSDNEFATWTVEDLDEVFIEPLR